MNVVFNYTMNRVIRMLDGQWQGMRLASDGRVYFFGGSHSPEMGAPMFRYNPATESPDGITLLSRDLSAVCGEDVRQVPPQGKVHSDILEHQGWLYFGTHQSDYTAEGSARYTGAHLLGYEMATGRFRDFGVIHRNYTNYSGVGLDARHGRIYFYATPFSSGDGPHLHRIDIASGHNEDLGLVAPWKNQAEHGQPSAFLFVDGNGDCWFTLRDDGGLYVARADSGRIERFADALPCGKQWYCTRTLGPWRALTVLEDGLWHFDADRFDGSSSAFTRLRTVTTPGWTWCYLAADQERVFWNSRSNHPLPETGRYDVRVYSSPWADLSQTRDHGPIVDAEGHAPWFIGDLVSNGRGRLFSCGRWYVRPDEYETIGVNRHGLMCAVFFTVLDVGN